MLTLDRPPAPAPTGARCSDWRCQRAGCNRFLATVHGDRFERPNGDSGFLPAVIRCKCGERNVMPRQS